MKIIPTALLNKFLNLVKLDLSENKLVSVPYSIHLLDNLKVLRLHMNRLNVLPREMADMLNLTELTVKNIYINGNVTYN